MGSYADENDEFRLVDTFIEGVTVTELIIIRP